MLEIPAIFFPNKREKEKTLFQGLKTANYPKTLYFRILNFKSNVFLNLVLLNLYIKISIQIEHKISSITKFKITFFAEF